MLSAGRRVYGNLFCASSAAALTPHMTYLGAYIGVSAAYHTQCARTVLSFACCCLVRNVLSRLQVPRDMHGFKMQHED